MTFLKKLIMSIGGIFMDKDFGFILFCIFLILVIAIIITMFVSLAKQEDERRRMIVEKSSTKSFAIMVLYFLMCIAENIFKVVSGKDLSPEGMNPFVTLIVVAVVYIVELLYHKKKYGD